MSEKEIINDFKENYAKVRKLLDEESKLDPENEPYLSKYKAKEILCNMRQSITKVKASENNIDAVKLDVILGAVLMNIGVIEIETEELTASEKNLTEAVDSLSAHASKPEAVLTLLNVYNNLGILWYNREEPQKSKAFLFKAKDLYESFKCTMQMPLTIENIIGIEETDVNDVMLLEKGHTLTLYYLAQVYGSLEENLKSAIYCHITLRRQLQYSDYEPIDWVLNSATLSQFFAELSGFYQARHHLAAASTILEQYEEKLMANQSDDEVFLAKVETLKHRSADVARCWVKYCLMLLTNSKQRLLHDDDKLPAAITDMTNLTLEDDENICNGDLKSLVFPNIDVTKYESKVTDKYLLTYDDARLVFLACQTWINKAKEYYQLSTLASDYIEIVQDSSRSYTHLSFFEEDDERTAKMHKRRVDMLENLVKEINPTYYMQYCRQLWYELGEVYSDILNIKLDKLNKCKEKPNPHALLKINVLCEKSMENFDKFLDSVKTKQNAFPSKIDNDLIRPVISALVFIGRNSMKRISVDKSMQLSNVQKSLDSYRMVVDICNEDQEAAAMMAEEYSLCTDMVNILPIKIQKIQSDLRNS